MCPDSVTLSTRIVSVTGVVDRMLSISLTTSRFVVSVRASRASRTARRRRSALATAEPTTTTLSAPRTTCRLSSIQLETTVTGSLDELDLPNPTLPSCCSEDVCKALSAADDLSAPMLSGDSGGALASVQLGLLIMQIRLTSLHGTSSRL
jgi:hypothetical protein